MLENQLLVVQKLFCGKAVIWIESMKKSYQQTMTISGQTGFKELKEAIKNTSK